MQVVVVKKEAVISEAAWNENRIHYAQFLEREMGVNGDLVGSWLASIRASGFFRDVVRESDGSKAIEFEIESSRTEDGIRLSVNGVSVFAPETNWLSSWTLPSDIQQQMEDERDKAWSRSSENPFERLALEYHSEVAPFSDVGRTFVKVKHSGSHVLGWPWSAFSLGNCASVEEESDIETSAKLLK